MTDADVEGGRAQTQAEALCPHVVMDETAGVKALKAREDAQKHRRDLELAQLNDGVFTNAPL